MAPVPGEPLDEGFGQCDAFWAAVVLEGCDGDGELGGCDMVPVGPVLPYRERFDVGLGGLRAGVVGGDRLSPDSFGLGVANE